MAPQMLLLMCLAVMPTERERGRRLQREGAAKGRDHNDVVLPFCSVFRVPSNL